MLLFFGRGVFGVGRVTSTCFPQWLAGRKHAMFKLDPNAQSVELNSVHPTGMLQSTCKSVLLFLALTTWQHHAGACLWEKNKPRRTHSQKLNSRCRRPCPEHPAGPSSNSLRRPSWHWCPQEPQPPHCPGSHPGGTRRPGGSSSPQ